MSLPWMPLYTPDFCTEGWRTPDTYVSREFGRIPDTSGIYLLVASDFDPRMERVAYVGQAKRLSFRLKSHEIYSLLCKSYDHIGRYFKLFPLDRLREVERHYIELFDPPYNIAGRKRGWPRVEAI